MQRKPSFVSFSSTSAVSPYNLTNLKELDQPRPLRSGRGFLYGIPAADLYLEVLLVSAWSRVFAPGVGAAPTAVALTDDEAIIGLSPNPSLLSARQRLTHSRTPLTQRRTQPGLADLLNIVDVGGSRGGDDMAPGHSVGLDAGLLGDPLPSLWARRANICVDVLVRLERVSHGSTPKDASVAALIFSVLFPYYCKTVLNVGEERSHTGHQKENRVLVATTNHSH